MTPLCVVLVLHLPHMSILWCVLLIEAVKHLLLPSLVKRYQSALHGVHCI